MTDLLFAAEFSFFLGRPINKLFAVQLIQIIDARIAKPKKFRRVPKTIS